MTATLDLLGTSQHRAALALRDYLRRVANALGVGLESVTVDEDTPMSAYLALEGRLPAYPSRDLALLWDEQHGWAAAIETHCGEDLIVLSYLGGDTITPDPRRVVRFVEALRREDHTVGQPDPPALRAASGHENLLRCLGSAA